MAKVYIVTSGHYSDYGINAVFLDEEKAKYYVDLMNRAEPYLECGIETFDSDTENPQILYWRSQFDSFTSVPFALEKVRTIPCVEELERIPYDTWSLFGYGRTPEESIKSLCDNRAGYLAAQLLD